MRIKQSNEIQQETKWNKAVIHLLCCFVFGAGYITPAIPNGDVYIAGITGIVVLSGGFFHIHQRKSITQLSLIDAAFWVYLIYTLLNAHSPVDFGTIIRTISIAGIWWYVRQCDLSQSTTTIAMWAMYSGVGQTLIGLLQMMRLISSNHSYFMATGTFNNPGVWGGYLAIMLAIVLPQVSTKQRQQKTWLWMGSCIILIGILLSNSRAAWLATLVTIILLLWLQYRETMMKKRIHLALFLALPIIGYLLYILHPASIDARWHIWKVGLKMFSQSPLFGVGTGGFAVHFMPTQADYLSTATWEVQRLADDNLLAFNDLLLILYEQGCMGLLLFSSLAFLLIRSLFTTPFTIGIQWLIFPLAAICTFSQFSYVSSTWSLFVFLPFLAATIPYTKFVTSRIYYTQLVGVILGCGLLLIGLFYIRKAQHWINRYGDLEDVSTIPSSVDFMVRHDSYLSASLCQAARLIADNDVLTNYAPVLESYLQTAQWKLHIGEGYEAKGDYQQAIHYYQQAHRMMPGLLLPLYAQFSLYRELGDKLLAKQFAQQVVHHTPKLENKQTLQMKNDAQNYLISQP